jgi:hypothetical protein
MPDHQVAGVLVVGGGNAPNFRGGTEPPAVAAYGPHVILPLHASASAGGRPLFNLRAAGLVAWDELGPANRCCQNTKRVETKLP